ncbi:lipocalin-like domain-containing protein [Clostridium oryzae]|uniref:Extracellular endo-alpha-(1->5)-L-arabinanase C-terminal domain-containing protein n=1 Tax=Clostridium oryzae TaxID=1450648 RepID=A0A1V4IYE7_9CLOT|nr:glycoside hydrolase family 43 C-terminal domain-containing protein [Clostridium oryzae]OPJ64417.1 hypothetical protein CLORY_06110 [Clostridium oryzae]
MGKITGCTLESLKKLIPNFLRANTIKAANEYRAYETVYTENNRGVSSSINLLAAKSLEDEFVLRLPVVTSTSEDAVSAENPNPVQALSYTTNKSAEELFEVRELFWTSDGWPVISPECYKEFKKSSLLSEKIIGHYEFVKLTPTLPQGVFNSVSLDILDITMQGASSTRNSWAVKMPENTEGRVELGGSIRGAWKLIDFETIEFTYANYKETCIIKEAWDNELDKLTIILTGKDSNGIACFAKKCDLPKLNF